MSTRERSGTTEFLCVSDYAAASIVETSAADIDHTATDAPPELADHAERWVRYGQLVAARHRKMAAPSGYTALCHCGRPAASCPDLRLLKDLGLTG